MRRTGDDPKSHQKDSQSFTRINTEQSRRPDTALILSEDEVAHSENRELILLTRTPLGPGLPCGPAKPCKKSMTLVTKTRLQRHFTHMDINLKISDSKFTQNKTHLGGDTDKNQVGEGFIK